ncbi:MAG: hypothetical protein M3021_05825, partial [Actinomycetota bacterium]|nr:hypothetical protein [Actinomycetota bacterium]
MTEPIIRTADNNPPGADVSPEELPADHDAVSGGRPAGSGGRPGEWMAGKKHVVFGMGALAVGLLAGLLLGQLGQSVGSGSAGPSAASASSTASVSQPVDAAVQSCGVKSATGISIMDAGKSLEIQTAGKGKSGLAISDMGCVLRELKTPQSVIAKMDSTRA